MLQETIENYKKETNDRDTLIGAFLHEQKNQRNSSNFTGIFYHKYKYFHLGDDKINNCFKENSIKQNCIEKFFKKHYFSNVTRFFGVPLTFTKFVF